MASKRSAVELEETQVSRMLKRQLKPNPPSNRIQAGCQGLPGCEMLWARETSTLCDGNPLNVHKIWPERTETLHSSHWGNCKFCDLDGRKLLNQLTLDCGKVRRAKWPIPSSLLQQKSCPNLCCWLFQLHQRGPFSCRGDTALAYHKYYSLSLASCHRIECRSPNMRVADGTTVWVCKCLQLIYPSALHL